jgi:hypothetical protein
VYSDALAVAFETMQRARHNADLIYERLQKVGYKFTSPKWVRVPPTKNARAEVDEFEREIGPIPLSLRAWYEVVGLVDFAGSHPGLAGVEATPSFGDLRGLVRSMLISNPHATEGLDFDIDEDEVRAHMENTGMGGVFGIDALMGMFGMMKGEAKDLRENPPPPAEREEALVSDPLSIGFQLDVDEARDIMEQDDFQILADEFLDRELEEDESIFPFTIAPDDLLKANISGAAIDVMLPNTGADAAFLESERRMFVAYLRESFRWGGFPGLKHYPNHDAALLAQLREGLLPL